MLTPAPAPASAGSPGQDLPGQPRWPRRVLAVLVAAMALLTSGNLLRGEPPQPRDFEAYLERVQRAFQKARENWDQNKTNLEAAWKVGQAAFDWAEFATNDDQRAFVAEVGITACRHAAALDSNNVAAHYYLGLNLGQLARTRLLGALKLIDEMEREWTVAIRLDPKFDYGGPHRAIGVLYRDAPGWPTSIGSEKKSRLNLSKAIELHPEYPGNRLSYYEGLIEWGDKKVIREKAKETHEFLQQARAVFSGERWDLDWADWDRRWSEIRRKAGVKEPGL
jgi:hypothetical protein